MCQTVESLCHPTMHRPVVRYPALSRILGKMPSYLRRAAIEAAYGAVSSFLSNYSNWLDAGVVDGERRPRPPQLGLTNVFPSLYGGNMILVGAGIETVQVKLLQADGRWRFSKPFAVKGKFKRLLPQANKLDLCPALMQQGAKVWLSCPVKVKPPRYISNKAFAASAHRVCAVDVGINTAATAAIVVSTRTVIARKFFTCGRHNDRRDALGKVIAEKQRQSGRAVKGEPHCPTLYNRIAGISKAAARELASSISTFAVQHGAKAVVIEDLKGWRPKGPSKAQRKRFHRFQHRALVRCLTYKAQEAGLRLLEVYARGTSRWAYDGSGKVSRSSTNASLATFASGKRYHADLNGALNIAARGLAMLLGINPPGKEISDSTRFAVKAVTGKSSGTATRMPLVLADVWAYAQTLRGAYNRQALPAGVLVLV